MWSCWARLEFGTWLNIACTGLAPVMIDESSELAPIAPEVSPPKAASNRLEFCATKASFIAAVRRPLTEVAVPLDPVRAIAPVVPTAYC